MTDGSIRFLAGLSLAALAAITGIVSYLHALTVVHLTGSAAWWRTSSRSWLT